MPCYHKGKSIQFGNVKNERLGFTILYSTNGEPHEYVPDFIVRINDGHGGQRPREKRKERKSGHRPHFMGTCDQRVGQVWSLGFP